MSSIYETPLVFSIENPLSRLVDFEMFLNCRSKNFKLHLLFQDVVVENNYVIPGNGFSFREKVSI